MNKVKIALGVSILALAGLIAVQVPALAAKKPIKVAQANQTSLTYPKQGMMSEDMQKMMQDPRMMDAMEKMMKDPEVAKIMSGGSSMLDNPKMKKAMEKYLPKDLAEKCTKLMIDIKKDVKKGSEA